MNLKGKYMHIVADMRAYTASAVISDTVSVCSLGIFGTKYVRDDSVPTSISIIQGQKKTIRVSKIYSFYQIGNDLSINLRQRSELDFVVFIENTSWTDVQIDSTGL